MKQTYLTPQNIEQKSAELLKGITRKSLHFSIEKSALLVLDMQDFFLSESSHAYIPSAQAIIPNIEGLVRFYEKNSRPVIFTKHINNTLNAGMMGEWWQDLIQEDEIISDFQPTKILEKTQYDAFYNTELDNLLQANGVKQVIITGVMAHLCCETTARSAFVRGYQPFFIADATASYNESFHKASILSLSHGFAHCCTSKDLTN